MISYYVDRGNKPAEMLWTDKFQPKRAMEVSALCCLFLDILCHNLLKSCSLSSLLLLSFFLQICGNDESVKFLNEWLRLWCERHHQNGKCLNGLDESSSLENSNSYHLHDSDLEFTEEGARLKNVLLIIGPVGVGTSASLF